MRLKTIVRTEDIGKLMKDIEALIAESYTREEALAYSAYKISKEDHATIVAIAQYILKEFPQRPNCCVPMSAMWVTMVRDKTKIPMHMVAGSLDFQKKRIFGDTDDMESLSKNFSKGSLNWNGHCWVVCGKYVGDISFFRTAYNSPAWLKNMVTETFGIGKGLLWAEQKSLITLDLEYIPKYVLNAQQIEDGAISMLQLKEQLTDHS